MINKVENCKIKYKKEHGKKQDQYSNDLEKFQLISELHSLRIENEILKERLIQIKELTSL